MNIFVKELINSSIAISSDKAKILRDEILKGLSGDSEVIVDFEGITDLTTAFLNTAIGHLYVNYTGKQLNESLKLVNLDEMDIFLLNQVIKRAKMNEKSKMEFHRLIKEVLNDDKDS